MSMNRRSFLKVGGATLASIPMLAKLASFAGVPAYAEDLPPAKDTEEPAKSLKYCADADKPSKNCEARKDKAKASQYCYNCQLFTKGSGDGKGATGKCMIMPKNSVPGKAWCQSWVKNPAVNG